VPENTDKNNLVPTQVVDNANDNRVYFAYTNKISKDFTTSLNLPELKYFIKEVPTEG